MKFMWWIYVFIQLIVFVSGIWLLVIGEWKVVIVGFIFSLFSFYLLCLILIPPLCLGKSVASYIKKGQIIKGIFFSILIALYMTLFIGLWREIIFFQFFMAYDNTALPVFLWSYGVAVGPWALFAAMFLKSL